MRGPIAMRKILDILRLHFSSQFSNQVIADSLRLSKGTVFNCLQRFQHANLSWPLPDTVTHKELTKLLYPPKIIGNTESFTPDFERILEELKRPHVTRAILYKEYRDNYPKGMKRSSFYRKISEYATNKNVTLSQHHIGGDKLFIDYSGDMPSYINLATGECVYVELFAASWGASSYTFAEVTPTQSTADFVHSHVRAFRFFGCVPAALVPDNLKAAVLKPSFADPNLNPLYEKMAAHYDTALLPARPYKPRDKAVIESNILHLQRYILGRLRDRMFFSFAEIQEAVHDQMVLFNAEPMQLYQVSRLSRFEALDKPFAKPLPMEDFALRSLELNVKVRNDYHVQFKKHYYSVPFTLSGKSVEVHSDDVTIQIYKDGERVSSHLQAQGAEHGFTTLMVHMPLNHQFWKGLSPEKLVLRGEQIGLSMAMLIRSLLDNAKHKELGYRAALGILGLNPKYDKVRLENAAARALHFGGHRLRDIQCILDTGLDSQPLPQKDVQVTLKVHPPLEHENIRGAMAFKQNI